MAENQTTQQKADEAVTEKQALDSNGKLKPGFAYRYETVRNDEGQPETRKVFFKAEG